MKKTYRIANKENEYLIHYDFQNGIFNFNKKLDTSLCFYFYPNALVVYLIMTFIFGIKNIRISNFEHWSSKMGGGTY